VSQSDLDEGMATAARAADFLMLEWVCARTRNVHSALYAAIKAGDVELLQWLAGETLGGDGAAQQTLMGQEHLITIMTATKTRAWGIRKWLVDQSRMKALGY